MVQKIQDEPEYLTPILEVKREEIYDFRKEYEETVEGPWMKQVTANHLTVNTIKTSTDVTMTMYGTIESQQSKATSTSKKSAFTGNRIVLRSILRIHQKKEDKSQQTKTLKKNTSVEFALDVLEEPIKLQRVESQQTETVQRSFPRRLTEEEKEELYRLRPDLQVSPIPFLFEGIEALRRKKRRRMILCVGCGLVMMFALLFIYHILTGV